VLILGINITVKRFSYGEWKTPSQSSRSLCAITNEAYNQFRKGSNEILEANTCSGRKARENARMPVKIAFGYFF